MANIMVVDDAMFMRRMLKDILIKNEHIIVTEAGNGVEAIEKYKEFNPEIVFLDITMPEKDGLQTVKEILQYDKNAKVVMCSAMGQECMVKEAIVSGAKDFIVKPFNQERILESIKKIIKTTI